MQIAFHLAAAGGVYDGVFFVLSFIQWDVLDEILDLIQSVSEGFPSYFCKEKIKQNYRVCRQC